MGETYDGALNDMNGFHVKPSHVDAAIQAAAGGPVAEGNVGGGTGMICHEFKGGIGTASRVLPEADGGWVVGALVQANYGSRELLRIDGVPVGQEIPRSEVPSAWDQEGAIEAAAVTDASPAHVLPDGARRRLDHRGPGDGRPAAPAPVRAPGPACRPRPRPDGQHRVHGSGDLFIAFATGNRGLSRTAGERDARRTVETRMVVDRAISPLFQAAIEATEAAVVGALLAGRTLTGRDGITAHALDHDRLLDVMARYGRGPRASAG